MSAQKVKSTKEQEVEDNHRAIFNFSGPVEDIWNLAVNTEFADKLVQTLDQADGVDGILDTFKRTLKVAVETDAVKVGKHQEEDSIFNLTGPVDCIWNVSASREFIYKLVGVLRRAGQIDAVVAASKRIMKESLERGFVAYNPLVEKKRQLN